MKEKKLLFKSIVACMIAVVLAVGGYFVGHLTAPQKILEKTVVVNGQDEVTETPSITLSDAETISAKRIAVVDLDEGTTRNGEKVTYASALMNFPTSDFVTTGLEDARSGIANGDYAAYILIPASFSDNIQSFNSAPEKSSITYALCPDLDSESIKNAISQVMTFEQGLSDKASYLYVNSIMNEFHGAQDQALNVLSNDTKDAEALKAIQPYDLTERITLPTPQTSQLPSNWLSVADYSSKDATYLTDLNSKYSDGSDAAQTGLQSLIDNGSSAVSTASDNLSTTIDSVNMVTDEDGNSIYHQTLSDGYESEIDQQNAAFTAMHNKLTGSIPSESDDAVAKLQASIGKYNAELQAVKSNLLVQVNNMYPTPTTVPTPIPTPTPEYTYTIDGAGIAVTMNKDGTSYPVASIGPSSYDPGSGTFVYDAVQVDSFVNAWKADSDSVIANIYSSMPTPAASTIDTTKLDDLRDDINNNLVDYNGLAWTQDPVTGTYTPVTDVDGTQLLVEGEINQIKDEADGWKNGDSSLPDSAITSGDLISRMSVSIESTVNTRAYSETQRIRNAAADQTGAVTGFQTTLGSFNLPSFYDQASISSISEGLRANMTDLGTAVMQQNTEQNEYLADVDRNAQENIINLQNTIQYTNEESNQVVQDGLENAIAVKSASTENNKILLSDFTKKLSYTKVGSLDNTAAYEFMVNPLLLSETAVEKAVKPSATKGATTTPTTGVRKDGVGGDTSTTINSSSVVPTNSSWIIALAIILGLILLAVLFIIIIKRKRQDNGPWQIK